MPQLVVLARRPAPGRGKTRLRARLSIEACGRLQARLLDHTLAVAEAWAVATGGRVRLQLAAAGPRSCRRDPWRAWQAQPQGAGGLGLRLQRALVTARRRGNGSVLLIGADLPDLSLNDLLQAGELLQRQPLVLGPAVDGGYLLLGLAAWLDPPRRLQSANRVAKENCLDGMPSLLDGMVIALEAGQSLSRSMEVSLGRGFRKGDEEWVAAMRQALEDMRRGLGVEPAFSRLRRVLPIPVVYRFAATCVLGETQGQSIAGVLKRQAEQCRREAQMAIEKRALQAPVKLMAPLMICIFPCTFLVLLAPLSRSLLSVGGI